MSDPHDTPPIVGAVNYKGDQPTNTLVTAAFIVLAIMVLYLGAGIFVPLVLAVLLAFALAPVVHRLRRLHLPHIVAVLLAVLLAGAVLLTIGYIVATQLIKLASDLPRYQTTVIEKFTALQQTLGGQGGTGFLSSLGDALGQLQGQLDKADGAETTRPMPVVITNDAAGPLTMVQSVLHSVLGPLTTAAIVAVFLIFLLLEREDLRDRFLKLVSRGDLRTSTKVMNEAAARVGRYLLVQFCVNLSYGVIYGTGLSLIGVPNAVLWGLLAAIFRYIPFVGTLIASSIPFTLAFAVDPGWSMLFYSVAMFATLELLTTNAIEPRLYERGVEWMISAHRREDMRATLALMASRLRHLLGGRLLGMLIEGIFTYVMLMAYGVPLAALLGMITGVLAFIPNIGAIISGVLMVTVGFTGGVEMGLYTIFVYFFVQTIDGWILVPLIAKRTVDLAPALVLGWQLILGVLFGILGLALADPMLAMIKVALERRAERQDEVLKRREAHRHNQPASKRRTRKTAKAT